MLIKVLDHSFTPSFSIQGKGWGKRDGLSQGGRLGTLGYVGKECD